MVRKHQQLIVAATVALAIAGGSVAGQLTLPHVFTPNTPAKASEVNANFDAVKTANDAADRKLSALEQRLAKFEAPLVWQPVAFQQPWKNYSADFQSAEYTKDAFGFVHLRGLVSRSPSEASSVIAVLPPGFRPVSKELFDVINGGGDDGRLDVEPSGEIRAAVTAGQSFFQLSGVTFWAAQ
jgi:hypothetical protein